MKLAFTGLASMVAFLLSVPAAASAQYVLAPPNDQSPFMGIGYYAQSRPVALANSTDYILSTRGLMIDALFISDTGSPVLWQLGFGMGPLNDVSDNRGNSGRMTPIIWTGTLGYNGGDFALGVFATRFTTEFEVSEEQTPALRPERITESHAGIVLSYLAGERNHLYVAAGPSELQLERGYGPSGAEWGDEEETHYVVGYTRSGSREAWGVVLSPWGFKVFIHIKTIIHLFM